MDFYKYAEPEPGPEPPPEIPDPPAEPEPNEPEGIEGDYKIKNIASVKVNEDPGQITDTVENPMAAELVVGKEIYGTIHNSDKAKEFEFTITLTPGSSAEQFDPRALSVIKTNGTESSAAKISWSEVTQIQGKEGVYSGTGTIKLKPGEYVHIAGITCEISYIVQESEEENYQLHHVTVDGREVTADERTVSGTIKADKTTTEVVYHNLSELVSLPATGGTGTNIYYLIGGLLVIGAILLLIIEKKKNRNASA